MPRPIDADALFQPDENSDKVLIIGGQRCGGKTVALAMELLKRKVAEAPTIAPAPRWIPVTERLPEEEGYYLGYFEDGMCVQVRFDETEQTFGEWINEFSPDTLGWCGEHFEDYQGITHWMPLPEPPEDGGAENGLQ